MKSFRARINGQIRESLFEEQNKLTWIKSEWQKKEFEEFIEFPRENFSRGQVIDQGRNHLIKIDKFSKGNLMIKKFNLTRLYDKLRFCFLDSKAVRSLRIALALKKAGVKTPEPIAVVEERGRFNHILYSYYITEYIDYDYNLLTILADDNHPLRGRIKELLPAIARDVKKFHEAGIVHNDLHAGNILVNNIDSESPDFFYIDLNRGRIKNSLSAKTKLKDLARFKFKDEEWKIFMKNYSPNKYNSLMELMFKQRQKRKKFLRFRRKLKSIFNKDCIVSEKSRLFKK